MSGATDIPWFSVIVPFHDRGAHIDDCLESIARQRPAQFEIICVDDGSTDDTLARLRHYARPSAGFSITVLHQDNAGPGAARNAGAAAARGRYLAFLDSDDRWLPWTLQTYKNALLVTGMPAFLTGQPALRRSHNDDAPPSNPLRLRYFADYFSSSDAWRWFSASSFVIRRDVFDRVGGFTTERMNGEDAELTMRLGTEAGFVHVEAPATFCYLEHPDSEVHNWDQTLAGWQFQYRHETLAMFPGGQRRARDRLRILTRASRSLSLALIARRRRADALRIYQQTFRWNLELRRFRYLIGFWIRAAGA
ncbi:MAG: glycosyltransferase family A protein [Pseudomonadota bacterium]